MLDQVNDAGPGQAIQDWLRQYPQEIPIVAVPVFNAYDDVMECVQSLLASTRAHTPILILDDASTDTRIREALLPLAGNGRLRYLRKPRNNGFVGTVNLAFELCRPHDVVVVNSDVVVPPGWIERLQAAAYSFSTVATATPFTNSGTMVSVPYRNRPVGCPVEGMPVAEADGRIRSASQQLRPVIPTTIGHCMYIKRAALDMVGYLDEIFAPGYGEEVDFSLRAVMAGFSHVVADDLFVYHKGWRSFGSQGEETKLQLQGQHEAILNERYPWYRPWVISVEADSRSRWPWP